MKLKVFAILDSKVGAYLNPFMMRSVGEASRAFETAVNDPTTQFSKYPSDYELYEIAEWDDTVGTYEQHFEKKVCICNAVQCLKKVNLSAAAVASSISDLRKAFEDGTDQVK